MTSNKHPIGLFGGTFDPIHCGHLKIAEQLTDELNLQGMQFIPNKHPMHRKTPDASAEHRLAMTRAATANYPKFIVNDVEINRPGPTYSIDTITAIRDQIPEQPLCLILGEDVFASLDQWRDWEKIPVLVHIAIINRLGVPLPYNEKMHQVLVDRETTNIHDLCKTPGGSILQVDIGTLTLSATEVRKKLKAGIDVSKDLPPSVLRYIHQHHLYGQ